ncbi:MAG: hypothetical protein CL670_14865 [Balneola sp.]|jgi:enterochelin esterase-like enzyme|nr:hypothetical protein [Balneola sp.]MBE80438.1 hypothetical protein [Balneola sp.]HAD51281.1 hypothetical protein [Algoriphagus sp.]|tara:strand:- start:387 stop:1649 length:1263 start_codon:yes stop_codon:yes gene_type:complete
MISKRLVQNICLLGILVALLFSDIAHSQDLILEKIPSWRSFPDCSESIDSDKTACRITQNPSLDEARAYLDSSNYSIWSNGNTWSAAYRLDDESIQSLQLMGGIQLPLSRFENTDIWAISLNIPGLDTALISTSISYQKGASFVTDDETIRIWRGKNAEAKQEITEDLNGIIKIDSIWSDTLKEWRKISIYKPSKAPENGTYPVVYFADGQGVGKYAQIIDPLIKSGELPPVILVGIWGRRGLVNSNKPYNPTNDYRTVEYHEGVGEYPGADSLLVVNHHLAHKYYFTHEVPAIIEAEYNASKDRTLRAIHGVSSGANFALLIGREMPDKFGLIIANSLGPETVKKEPVKGWENAAMHYLSVGLLEQQPMRSNLASLYNSLKENGIPSILNVFPSGHDSAVWVASFPETLKWWMKEIKDQ